MRICSPHVGLFPSSNSGGVVYERELLKQMALQEAELEIILPKGQPYERGINNWHIHNAPFGRGYRWYISNLIFPHIIKQVYDKTQFQVLRAHSLRFIGPAALWAKKYYALPVPVVAHHHHIDLSSLNLLLDKPIIKACDLVTTDSLFSKQQIIDTFDISGDHIEVIYAGVNAAFTPQAPNLALKQRWNLGGKKILLTLGGLKKRKNNHQLLDIFQGVVKELGETVVLVIAGSGPQLPSLQQQAKILGLENQVRFTGFVSEVEKIALYNIVDIYLSASSMEGFGMTPAEAMACGKPAIVSDAGSLPEVVLDNQTGFVVSTEKPNYFSSRIVQLLAQPNLATHFGRAGRKHVAQNFTWEQVAKTNLQLYQNLLRKFADAYPNS